MNSLSLWLAQGFGVGRIPFAPGTFGSVIGLAWFALLLAVPSAFLYVTGLIVGISVSVKAGTQAEKLLRQRDPSSVVLDEIIAVPLCFASWIGILYSRNGVWPSVEHFFNRQTWPLTLAVLVAFRCFDIAKPWPVRQSQSLPGGWGITADDVLAAVYVNLGVLGVVWLNNSWPQ